jgi:Domain of unknown function (DUF4349)/Collagen triple helix repeat (20 copies)
MIDEQVLEQLLAEIAGEIEVPADGAERVVHALSLSARPARRPSPPITRALVLAAAVAVLVLVGVSINNATNGKTSIVADRGLGVVRHGVDGVPTTVVGSPSNGSGGDQGIPGAQGPTGVPGGVNPAGPTGADGPSVTGAPGASAPGGYYVNGNLGLKGAQGPTGAVGVTGLVGQDGPQGAAGNPGPQGLQGPTGLMGGAGAVTSSSGGIQDGAKIVKAGALDLVVPHGRLRTAVSRVSGVATGYGGYMANTQTKYGGDDATATITMRIPVANFEAAIKQLTHLDEVTVLSQSTTGADVTDQYTNVQAQMISLNAERDSFLALLSAARDVNQILMLHDRVTGVQSQIDQLQGRLNLLDHQSSLSSLAITISERPAPAVAKAAAAKAVPPPTGLSKSWKDARNGFSDSIGWLLARSGGALIALIAALALLFGLRYLYPVVRRGLL